MTFKEVALNEEGDKSLFIIYNMNDDIKGQYSNEKSTVFGLDWISFMNKHKISVDSVS